MSIIQLCSPTGSTRSVSHMSKRQWYLSFCLTYCTQELRHSSADSWVLSALFHTPHSPSYPLTLTGTCRATLTAQYLWLETAG